MTMAELDEEAKQERRRRAGELLRVADKLLKAADIEGAARNVRLAIEADPRNPYAKAFEERIRHATLVKSAPPPEGEQADSSPQRPASADSQPRTPDSPPKVSPARKAEVADYEAAIQQELKRRDGVEQELRAKLDEVTVKLQAERTLYAELSHQQEVSRAQQKEHDVKWREAEAQIRNKREEADREIRTLKQQFKEEKSRLLTAEREKAAQEMKRMEESLRSRFKEEARAKVEEESRRIAQEESRKSAAERSRLEEEMRARMEEERRTMEERSRKERDALSEKLLDKDAESKTLQEGIRRAVEQERAALEEERSRLNADVAAQREELRKKESDIRQSEDELRSRLEEELKQRVTEERARLDEEMRQYLEVERLRLENSIRQQAELEANKQRETVEIAQYEDAVKRAIEEGRHLAQGKKLKMYTEKARDLVVRGEFELALKEVTKALLLNPEHDEARSIERAIYAARQDRIRRDEQAARMQADQEAKMKEIQRKMDEQARRDREEEVQRTANAEKVAESFRRAERLFEEHSFTKALREIETIFALDPGNPDALDLEMNILNAMKKQEEAKAMSEQRSREGEARRKEEEQKEQAAAEKRETLRRESVVTYRGMLKRSWLAGQPSKEEKSMLEVVRRSLAVGEDDHAKLEREVQLEAYTDALRSAWKSGIISTDDIDTHENLRQLYGMGREEHLVIEAGILQELKRAQERT